MARIGNNNDGACCKHKCAISLFLELSSLLFDMVNVELTTLLLRSELSHFFCSLDSLMLVLGPFRLALSSV